VRVFTEALAPYIGATMAGASVRGQCDKLAIEDDDVSEAQIEALIAAISPGLHVFVGDEKTATIIRDLRVSLTGLRRPA